MNKKELFERLENLEYSEVKECFMENGFYRDSWITTVLMNDSGELECHLYTQGTLIAHGRLTWILFSSQNFDPCNQEMYMLSEVEQQERDGCVLDENIEEYIERKKIDIEKRKQEAIDFFFDDVREEIDRNIDIALEEIREL